MRSMIKILINRALTNNRTKTMVIKIHINKIKSLTNKMDNIIKIKKAINNMKVKKANKLKVKKDTMISIINKVMELSLILTIT